MLVDDQRGDILPLIQRIEWLGYDVRHVATKSAAERELAAVREGDATFAHAIIDVMISTHDIESLMTLDEDFFADSMNTGIELCKYARQSLGLTAKKLPIVCITSRTDPDVRHALEALGIPLYSRVPGPTNSILDYLKRKLPRRLELAPAQPKARFGDELD